jgi:glycosyltransferase involved in cell wall biosynthesis
LRLVRRLDNFDAVFVYREAALLGPALLEKLVARRGKPIIYQLDDPLYVPYVSPSNGYFAYLKFFGKVAEICRVSRTVIVNSTHHREYASQYNQNIWQIPSLIDTEKYTYRERQPNGAPICVGWSGSPTTVGNLRVIADALRKLQDRQLNYRLQFIGGTGFDLPGVNYAARAWAAETEVEDLRQMEIGMVPLPVNEWNKRKFYMKVVQYMALGIPPVATPLGSNPEVIEHGVTGFLADSTEQWVDCLEQLVSDADLRLRMSRRAARVAEEKYSLAANAGKIVDAFRSAVA